MLKALFWLGAAAILWFVWDGEPAQSALRRFLLHSLLPRLPAATRQGAGS